jgi:hypothetical protein
MNHLLYNFSIVMLLLGIILITSYLTKAYDKPITNTCNNQNNQNDNPTIDQVYAMKPSQIYDAMFQKPSLWQGYESVGTKAIDNN